MSPQIRSSAAEAAVISLSFLTFGLIYISHRRHQPDKGPEWSIRLVTMTHASLVTSLAYFSGFVLGPWPFTDPGLESNSFNLIIISICLGYFILDYLWCLLYGAEGLIMHVHHWFSLIYLSWGLRSGLSGAEIVGVIFGSEITNPMLQMRWMLKTSGKYQTTVGFVNDILFVTTFISIRCVVGAYFLFCVLTHPLPTIAVRVGGVVFYAISAIFGFQILNFAKRKIQSRRRCGAPVSQNHGAAVSQPNSAPVSQNDGASVSQHDGAHVSQHDGAPVSQHDGAPKRRKTSKNATTGEEGRGGDAGKEDKKGR